MTHGRPYRRPLGRRARGASMPRPGRNRSKQAACKGLLLLLRPLVLALLGALVFAGSALAATPAAGSSAGTPLPTPSEEEVAETLRPTATPQGTPETPAAPIPIPIPVPIPA